MQGWGGKGVEIYSPRGKRAFLETPIMERGDDGEKVQGNRSIKTQADQLGRGKMIVQKKKQNLQGKGAVGLHLKNVTTQGKAKPTMEGELPVNSP